MYILSKIRNWLFPKKETPIKEKHQPITQVAVFDLTEYEPLDLDYDINEPDWFGETYAHVICN